MNPLLHHQTTNPHNLADELTEPVDRAISIPGNKGVEKEDSVAEEARSQAFWKIMNSGILRTAILQILKDRVDEPAPEKYVMLALNVHYRIRPSWSELRSAMKDLDESRFLIGLTDDDKTVLWSLSTKGKHKALSI
jgi:hypothetical protein